MEKMTKKDKFKKFVYDHREIIARVTVYTTLIVGGIAIIVQTVAKETEESEAAANYIEAHNSWAESENEWLDEQHAADKNVFLLHDLSYLLVPKDTQTEWVRDRIQN